MSFREKSIAFLLVLTACGGSGPAGEWLVATTEDTLTTAEASLVWQGMPESARQFILGKEDPAEAFLTSLTLKSMVQSETIRLGVDTLAQVMFAGDAYLGRNALPLYYEYVRQQCEDSLTGEDLETYMRLMGKTVWITITDSLGSWSPEAIHLPELPPLLVTAVEGLEPGETAIIDGFAEVRLDSVHLTDPELVQMERERDDLEPFISERMVSSRAAFELQQNWRRFSDGGFVLDPAAFARLCDHYSDGMPMFAGDTLVVLPGFLLTSDLVSGALLYERTVAPVSPSSSRWLEAFCETILRRQAALQALDPAIVADIRGVDSVKSATAFDVLYGMFVLDSIHISLEAVESLYQERGSELLVPETRSVVALQLSDDQDIALFRELRESGELDNALDSFEGFPALLADSTSEFLTRPLVPLEVPGRLGDSLFALDPADTLTWLGPVPYTAYLCNVALRLAKVYPEHTPEFDEALPALEDMLLDELETARFDAWVEELEERYGPVRNAERIEQLSRDPSEW